MKTVDEALLDATALLSAPTADNGLPYAVCVLTFDREGVHAYGADRVRMPRGISAKIMSEAFMRLIDSACPGLIRSVGEMRADEIGSAKKC